MRHATNMVKVKPSDILPMRQDRRVDEKEKFFNKASIDINNANIRFNNNIIEPQKELILDTMAEVLDGDTVDPVLVMNKVHSFFDKVTDVRAQAGVTFDQLKAQSQLQENLRYARENGISLSIDDADTITTNFSDFDEGKELLKKELSNKSLYPKTDTLYIQSLLDEDGEIFIVETKENNNSGANLSYETDNSYAIDPSLLED